MLKTLFTYLLIALATLLPNNLAQADDQEELQYLAFSLAVDKKCGLLGTSSRVASELRKEEISAAFYAKGVTNEQLSDFYKQVFDFVEKQTCDQLAKNSDVKNLRNHGDKLAANYFLAWQLYADRQARNGEPLCIGAPKLPILNNLKSQKYLLDLLAAMPKAEYNKIEIQLAGTVALIKIYCDDPSSATSLAFQNLPIMRLFSKVSHRNSIMSQFPRSDFMTTSLPGYFINAFRHGKLLDKPDWAIKARSSIHGKIGI